MRPARAKRSRDQRGRNRRTDWRVGPGKRASRGGRKSPVVAVIIQEMDPKQKRTEECEEEAAVFLPAMSV